MDGWSRGRGWMVVVGAGEGERLGGWGRGGEGWVR